MQSKKRMKYILVVVIALLASIAVAVGIAFKQIKNPAITAALSSKEKLPALLPAKTELLNTEPKKIMAQGRVSIPQKEIPAKEKNLPTKMPERTYFAIYKLDEEFEFTETPIIDPEIIGEEILADTSLADLIEPKRNLATPVDQNPSDFLQGRNTASAQNPEIQEEALQNLAAYKQEPESQPTQKSHEPNLNPPVMREYWLWAGAGASFVSYRQAVSGMSDVSFGRINTPSISINSGFMIADVFGINLNYRDFSGEVLSSSTISVSNGAYHYKTMGAELIFAPEQYGEIEKRKGFQFLIGLQQDQAPFLVPTSANNISVKENSASSISATIRYRHYSNKNIRLEYGLKYLIPISSSADVGSTYEEKSKVSLLGSIGAAYEFKKNFFLGTHLNAQYQKNIFSYKGSTGSTATGNQLAVINSFEIKMGVEF